MPIRRTGLMELGPAIGRQEEDRSKDRSLQAVIKELPGTRN